MSNPARDQAYTHPQETFITTKEKEMRKEKPVSATMSSVDSMNQPSRPTSSSSHFLVSFEYLGDGRKASLAGIGPNWSQLGSF